MLGDKMKTTLLIIYNRLITFICKLFRREGSVFPGSLVRKHDKNILKMQIISNYHKTQINFLFRLPLKFPMARLI